MRTIVIVQARFASTRLPGKTMLSLGRRTVLAETLARCSDINGIDGVCCAISEGFGSEILACEAEAAGATVAIGSDRDVLARYHQAAEMMQADVILRVTSDCPLIDPAVCDAVLLHRAERNAEYCANNQPAMFPHGLDCEAFTRRALEAAHIEAKSAFDREHVTPFLCREAQFSRAFLDAGDRHYVAQRWTLDFPEDYRFLHGVFQMLGGSRPGWRDLAARISQRGDLLAMNAMRVDPAR